MVYFAASADSIEENTKFAGSLELDYPILSDPGRETAKAFGVISGDGKYPARHTFYIGPDGKLLHVDREVSPRTAGEDMVARLEALKTPKTQR